MRKMKRMLVFGLLLITLQSCDSGYRNHKSSVVDYLYPNQQVTMQHTIPQISLPIKVGIAFVPGEDRSQYSFLRENEKIRFIDIVRQEFEANDLIGSIQIIPSYYLYPKGGFKNLSEIKGFFDIDIAVLVSYDQIQQFQEDQNPLYALVPFGTCFFQTVKNDTYTMVDATVYHIESQKLLFRASGTSQLNNTSAIDFNNKNLLKERNAGFELALKNMIPSLKNELEQFKVRVKEQPQDYQVVYEPGYTGAGSLDFAMILVALIGLMSLLRYRKA